METEAAGVAAITVICYLAGLVMKVTPWSGDRYIPIACGLVGGALGVLGLYTGLPDIPAGDPVTALAVGIASGLSATGVHQIGRQLSK